MAIAYDAMGAKHEFDLGSSDTRSVNLMLYGSTLMCWEFDKDTKVDMFDVPSGKRVQSILGVDVMHVSNFGRAEAGPYFLLDYRITSKVEIWQHSPELKKIRSFNFAKDNQEFSVFDSRLFVSNPPSLYSITSGECLWKSASAEGTDVLLDGQFFHVKRGVRHSLLDGASGQSVFELSHWRWYKEISFPFYIESERHSSSFFTITYEEGKFANQISSWKQTRPAYWYGVAWLAEFWMTGILAIAFVWSLFRDRRSA